MTCVALHLTAGLSLMLACSIPAQAQDPSQGQQDDTAQEETLAGADAHQIGQGPRGHLFGDWRGARSRWLERGIRFDFHYVSDSLANVVSEQSQKFFGWNRVRATVDIDFGKLNDHPGWYFH